MSRLVCAVFASLLLAAAPAFAQDAPVCTGVGDEVVDCGTSEEPTVGDPDVITDPADEIDEEGPAEPVDPRAEQHVLGDSAEASNKRTTQHAAGSPQPAAPAAPAAPSATASQAAAPASPAQRLPFTGVDAWVLALAGSLLLAAGLRMRQLA
jgi:hypothetical protein